MSLSLAFWAKALVTSTVPAATKTSVFATKARQLNDEHCGFLVLMQWSLAKIVRYGLPALTYHRRESQRLGALDKRRLLGGHFEETQSGQEGSRDVVGFRATCGNRHTVFALST